MNSQTTTKTSTSEEDLVICPHTRGKHNVKLIRVFGQPNPVLACVECHTPLTAKSPIGVQGQVCHSS